MRGEYHDNGGDDDHARKQCDRIERLIGLLKNPPSDEHVTRDDDVPHHVKYLCLKVLASVVYMESKVRYEHVEDAQTLMSLISTSTMIGSFRVRRFPPGFLPSKSEPCGGLKTFSPINADDLLKLLCLDLGIQTPKESFYNGFPLTSKVHGILWNISWRKERRSRSRSQWPQPGLKQQQGD